MSTNPGAGRVLHVITTLDRGGAEKALLELCRERARRSGPHRIGVAYLKGEGELAPDFESAGIEVRDLDARGLLAARARGAFDRFRHEFAPDVVHSHLFKADVLAASCLGRPRPGRERLVSTKHNVDTYLERPHWRVLGRAAAARCDAMIAISEGVAAHVRATLGTPRGGLDVVRYGVAPATRPATAPPAAGRLLCVARLEPQKDLRTLLAAFRLVRAERPATLTILGRGSMEAAIRAEAASIGGVELAGFVDDPTSAYDAADVVVLASRWEGLGLALVEAALRGRPVVATRVGGIPEVVDPGETGLLVEAGDARAFADAVLRLLGDPSLARRMGEEAARRAMQRFGVARCVDEHEAVYERVLGATR